MSKLWLFVREVYAPGLHVAFTAAWFLLLVVLLGAPVDARALHLVALGVVVLFYLRAVDEWKDEDYDRIHNPDRPLVRGAVTRDDVLRYVAGAAALSLALAWPLGLAATAIVAADLAWAVLLVFLERRSALVRDGMFVNLVLTYPVNVALSVLVLVVETTHGGVAFSGRGGLAVAAFACAFLHFEILRKTAWPAAATPGERLYSQVIGPVPSAALATVLALAAVLLLAFLVDAPARPSRLLLVLATTMVPLAAFRRFVDRGRTAPQARLRLRPWGMAFLSLFYLATIASRFLG